MRHMMRKDSPLFLLGAPRNSWTTPWTISAIWFTNVMILDCRTSVAVLKSRTLATPMMQSTRVPGIIAFTPELSPLFMLWPMMLAPASPKPRARSDPSLMIVFSKITVSIGAFEPVLQKVHVAICCTAFLIRSFWALFFLALMISSALNSSSAILIATKGSSRIASTRLIILSTGLTMSRLASFENMRETPTRSTKMFNVFKRLYTASIFVKGRRSK
mmetsp:Transcript_33666/g.85068  ORF Transcript_33666/g.85068 Transcript_33666/m.85068 type:complete len:217 (-) Transcript_33666:1253-1903(-)